MISIDYLWAAVWPDVATKNYPNLFLKVGQKVTKDGLLQKWIFFKVAYKVIKCLGYFGCQAIPKIPQPGHTDGYPRGRAENTHLLCKEKYHCTADLLFDWLGFSCFVELKL